LVAHADGALAEIKYPSLAVVQTVLEEHTLQLVAHAAGAPELI